MAKKKRSWLARFFSRQQQRGRPRVRGFRNCTIERLENRALLSGHTFLTLSQLLANMTPDPHPSGDVPADMSQVNTLSTYTAGAVPPDMPDIPDIHNFVVGVEAIYSGIESNSDARPAFWVQTATGTNQSRVFLDDNGMLITQWTIDWGDGTTPQTIGPAPWVVHKYSTAGDYTVTVTAIGMDGTYTADGVDPPISAAAPMLHVAGPQTVAAGQTFALDNLASFSSLDAPTIDPDSNTTTDFTYSVDWGDGSTPFTGIYADALTASGVTPFAGALRSDTLDGPIAHVYNDSGTYDVNVTVTDNGSQLSDTQTIPVTVVQLAPTINMSGLSVGNSCDEGATVGLSATVTADPSLSDPRAYNWQITDSSGNTVFQSSDPSPNYTFTAADTYTVWLVTSVDNVENAPITSTITVNNVAPSFVGTIPNATINLGQAYNLSTEFTDLNPNETHTVAVNWDSVYNTIPPDTGAQVTEESPDGSTPGTISDGYVYATTGTYNVTVTLTDSEGVSASPQTFQVTVISPTVALTEFMPSSDGSQLKVKYTVTGSTAAPFTIGIYASSDGVSPDQLLQSVTVDGSTDLPLTVGSDTASFTPQFDEIEANYHLIAVSNASSDPAQSTVEFDGGIFYAQSVTASPPQNILYVFGSNSGDLPGSGGDTLNIYGSGDTPANSVVFNSGSAFGYSSITPAITGIHVRGEDGNDDFTADEKVTLPLWLFGGSGTSTLTGGAGNNLIVGGTGQNIVHSSNGVTVPQTVDDSDTAVTGLVNYFGMTGTWTNQSTAAAFNGGEQSHAASSGSDAATWTFGNLDPTSYYEVYVTWVPIAGASTDAQYSVYDDTTPLASLSGVDQTQAPADLQAAGTVWHSLGVFQASSGTLAVKLDTDTSGDVLADTAMIVPQDTLPLTNLTMNSFSVDADGNLSVTYTINGEDSQPFSIGIYGSPDGVQPTTLHQIFDVDDPTLLTGGGQSHTATFPADLSGIGSSQYVLAVLNSDNSVAETSVADNVSDALSGVFEQSDGTLLILGNATSITGDNISLTQDLVTGDVTVSIVDSSGTPISSNVFSGVSSVIINTPGGSDNVTVDPSVTVPVAAYAGPNSNTTGTTTDSDSLAADSTTTVVSASSATPSYGACVTITAIVTSPSASDGIPTGSVDFYDQTSDVDLGSAAVSGNGSASFSISDLAAGSHVIVATYSGDDNFITSQGTATVTVTGGTLCIEDVYVSPSTVSKGGIATVYGDVANLDGAGFTLTITWGSNQGSGDTIVYPPGQTSFSLSHQYVDYEYLPFVGTYSIAITVTPDDGRSAATYGTSVSGVDAVPCASVNITTDTTVITEGEEVTVLAYVADPGEFGTFTYAWTATDGTDIHTQTGTSATFSFTPNDSAGYDISVVVTDADGNSAYADIGIPGGPYWYSMGTYTPFVPDEPTVTIEETDLDQSVLAGDVANFQMCVSADDMPNHGTVNVYYHTVNETAIANTNYIASGDQELTFTWDSCANSGAGGYDPQPIQVQTNGGYYDGTDKTFDVVTLGAYDQYAETPCAVGVTATAAITGAVLDVRTMTSANGVNTPGDWLAANLKNTSGAWLPVNTENNAYRFNGAQEIQDKDEPNSVSFTDDALLPIQITPVAQATSYMLVVKPTNGAIIRVYAGGIANTPDADNNHTRPLDLSKSIDNVTASTPFFVEGVAGKPGATATITLYALNANGNWDKQQSILIHLFTWMGPQDVPNFGTYSYVAEGGATNASGWSGAAGGVLQGQVAGGAVVLRPSASIQWNSNNPAIGMAIYQAATGYVWGYDVNVVAVTPGAGSVQILNTSQNAAKYPDSARDYMYANEAVTVAGPRPTQGRYNVYVSGVRVALAERGDKFINVGIIQILTFSTNQGNYISPVNGIATTTNQFFGGTIRGDTLTGAVAITGLTADDTVKGSKFPWYSSSPGTNQHFLPKPEFRVNGRHGAFIPFVAGRAHPNGSTDVLESVDYPYRLLNMRVYFGFRQFNLTQVNFVWNFNVYLAEQTTELVAYPEPLGLPAPSAIYTARTRARWNYTRISAPNVVAGTLTPTQRTFNPVRNGGFTLPFTPITQITNRAAQISTTVANDLILQGRWWDGRVQ